MRPIISTLSICLFCFIFFQPAVAQVSVGKSKFSCGNDVDRARNESFRGYEMDDQEHIYALFGSPRGIYGFRTDYKLELYDLQMNLKKSVKLELDDKREVLFLSYVGDKLFLFSNRFKGFPSRNSLWIQTVNPNTLQPNNDARMVEELRIKGAIGNEGRFRLIQSEDKSKMLVAYTRPNKKNRIAKIHLYAFNDKGKELWTHEYESKGDRDSHEFMDVEFSNAGNAYFLMMNSDYNPKKDEWKNQIVAVLNNGKTVRKHTIEHSDYLLISYEIVIDEERNALFSGGSLLNKDISNISLDKGIGVFMHKLNLKEFKPTSMDIKKFNPDLFTNGRGEKESKKIAEDFEKNGYTKEVSMTFDDLFLTDNGSVGMIMQDERMTIFNMEDRVNHYFKNNNLYVVSANPQGKIEWIKSIAKEQRSTNYERVLTGAFTFYYDGLIHVIYNDHPENLVAKGEVKRFKVGTHDCMTVLASFDSRGELRKQRLLTEHSTIGIPIPGKCHQLSKDKLLLFGNSTGNSQGCILHLN